MYPARGGSEGEEGTPGAWRAQHQPAETETERRSGVVGGGCRGKGRGKAACPGRHSGPCGP
eukprot:6755427-Lingulodinium_polyedra.AAC.1